MQTGKKMPIKLKLCLNKKQILLKLQIDKTSHSKKSKCIQLRIAKIQPGGAHQIKPKMIINLQLEEL